MRDLNEFSYIENRFIYLKDKSRVYQWDIFRINSDVGFCFGSKIYDFPYIFVASQDCDLLQDFNADEHTDKKIESIMILPLFFYEKFTKWNYIQYDIDDKTFEKEVHHYNSEQRNFIMNNNNPRFHYIKWFKSNNISIDDLIIDFKFFMSAPKDLIYDVYFDNYVCTMSELFREQVSQRFANFISRIWLPEIIKDETQPENIPTNEINTLVNN